MWTKLYDVNNDGCKRFAEHVIETKQEIIKWIKLDQYQYYLDVGGNVFYGEAGGDIKQLNQVTQ